jgi:hypothetical protein
MKKTILLLAGALLTSTMAISNASEHHHFTVVYGEKQINGDNIIFVKKGKWVKTTPVMSEWVNVGEATGCSAWTPATNTVATGISFEQTSSNCKQTQARTVQNREQNDYTLIYRNVGSPTNESRNLDDYSMTRTAVGTKIVNDCGSGDINNYRWVNGTASMRMMYIIWNGSKVFPDIGDINLTEYTYGGYKYTKGAQASNWGYYTFNLVCRTPI